MAEKGPALPPLTDRTIVKDHSSYGRSAFAAENIKRGEMVICEEPLLSFSATADTKVVIGLMKQLQAYLQAHPELHHDASHIHQDDWASALNYYLAYCKASEATQQLVLQEMFNSPAGDNVENTSPLRRTAVEAAVFAGMAPEITKVLKIIAAVSAGRGGAAAAEVKPASDDPAVVQKVLLASELNVHSMGGNGAMYKAGSKLTHTCDSPNTYYLSHKGLGCHVAMRDIAAGELLTTTYLVPEVQLLSVFGRKRYLWDAFAFECACQRCASQIDKLSAYPCSRCATKATARSKDGLLPNLMPGLTQRTPASSSSAAADGASSSSSSGGGGEVPGLLQFDPRKADPAVLRTHFVLPKEEHHSCCGHDHGDGHDHEHHHDHSHSHNGHSHEHKAAGAAAAGAAAAGAAGAEGGEEAAAAAAEASAGPLCWQCNKCGLQLPDRDVDIVGDFQVVREATARFERWAYNTAVHFDPQSDSAESDLRRVQLLLGPYHWAMHFIFTRQNELFTTIVRSVGMQLMQGGKLPAQYIDYLHKAVTGLQLNTNATWAWLTGPAGMSEAAAAGIMAPALLRCALSLVDTSGIMLMIPRFATSQGPLIAHMQALAKELVAKAEPGMERFSAWPLPEPHPLLRMMAEVKLHAEKAAEVAPAAAAAAAGGLNMDQLLDFLPAAGGGGGSGGKAAAGKAAGAAAGGAGKGKGKKKAAGKK